MQITWGYYRKVGLVITPPVLLATLAALWVSMHLFGQGGAILTALEKLQQAWVKAGYPKEYMPKAIFQQVAEHVEAAYNEGEEDFMKAGWQRTKADFPFAPNHPRYQAMLEAYIELSE